MSYFNLGQVDIEALAKLYGGTPAPTNTRPPAVMPVSKPAPADLGFGAPLPLQNLNMQDILPPLRKPDAPIASIQPPAKTRAQIAAEYTAQAPERLREQESLQAAMAAHLAETQPVTTTPELSAPELPAAVSTSPITAGKQAAFNASIAPIVANNRAINAQNNMVSAGGGGINYDSSTAVTVPTTVAPVASVSGCKPLPAFDTNC
jgi:hypothetical protein